jgi:hypothetical protein
MSLTDETIRETVVSHPDLERDRASRAILNRNRSDYVARRNHRFAVRQREEEFNDLKTQVEELKKLVKALTDK